MKTLRLLGLLALLTSGVGGCATCMQGQQLVCTSAGYANPSGNQSCVCVAAKD